MILHVSQKHATNTSTQLSRNGRQNLNFFGVLRGFHRITLFTSLLGQSPGGAKKLNFSPATVTSLGIANFLGKKAVTPQAVHGWSENIKLFPHDSDVIGHSQFSGDKRCRSAGSPQEKLKCQTIRPRQ